MTRLPAVVEALRFHEASSESLARIPEQDWPKLLDELDRAHLTLTVGVRCREFLPASVRDRIDRNLLDNAARHERLLVAHRELEAALGAKGIDYIVLKGITQFPDYVDNPHHRPQYDIDLYCPGNALAAVSELGYEPAGTTADPGADHLPVMIRKTGWTWRGNYFDPEMPPSLELHYRFWNPDHIGFEAPGVTEFWARRTGDRLNRADSLTYSCLHLLRHLLGGDLKLRHVYELAYFLDRSSRNVEFWMAWRPSRLEAIAFRLARDWFRCSLHPAAAQAVDNLPANIQHWFARFAQTPELDSDKSELWLHLCLIENRGTKCRIALRRLFPLRRSRVVLDAHVRDANPLARVAYSLTFFARRALHHLGALAGFIAASRVWSEHSKTPAPRSPANRKSRSGTVQP